MANKKTSTSIPEQGISGAALLTAGVIGAVAVDELSKSNVGGVDGFDNANSVAKNILSTTGSVFSTKTTAKYASGARCLLKINNKISAFAFGISWQITTDVAEINTIDDYLPAEIIPRRVSVQGSISALHIPGQSVTTELIQPDVLNFLFQKYITIEVRDSATDELLFYTNKAMITNRSETIQVDQLASVQLQFKAIGFADERKPELPSNLKKSSSKTNKPSDGLTCSPNNLLFSNSN